MAKPTTRTLILRYNPYTKKIQIYLQRKRNKTIETSGGKVDPPKDQKIEDFIPTEDEKLASALKEVQEETGLSSAELKKLGTYNYTNSYQDRNIETEVSLYWTLVGYKTSNEQMDYRKAPAEDKLIAGDWVDFDYFLRILERGETNFYSLSSLGISDEISGNTLIAKEIIEKLKGVREEILTNPEVVGEKEARVREQAKDCYPEFLRTQRFR